MAKDGARSEEATGRGACGCAEGREVQIRPWGFARADLLTVNFRWPGGGVVRADGIEPSKPLWKSGVLPLNYARRGKQGADRRQGRGRGQAGFVMDVVITRADAGMDDVRWKGGKAFLGAGQNSHFFYWR